ncbi:MAG: hypothetical protein HY078_16825 [Elusimicrobia bacterium]|nr:hypothetical protein [Elusimicrobiota bacterium]
MSAFLNAERVRLDAPVVFWGRISAIRDLGVRDGWSRWRADVAVLRAFRPAGHPPEKAMLQGMFTDDAVNVPEGGLTLNIRPVGGAAGVVFAESFQGAAMDWIDERGIVAVMKETRQALAGLGADDLKTLRCAEQDRTRQIELYDEILKYLRGRP